MHFGGQFPPSSVGSADDGGNFPPKCILSAHGNYHYDKVGRNATHDQVHDMSFAPSDSEEQRKIAEGADALLNLAGINTRKRIQSTPLYSPVPGKRIATRGRRKATPFRPRLLRSVRPAIKKKSESGQQQQRLTQRRKSQTFINNNSSSNNNNIVMASYMKAVRPSSRSLFHNTNDNELHQETRSEERLEKTKR